MHHAGPVQIGLERCSDELPDLLREGRIGLLMNQASVDQEFRHAHRVLDALCPGRLAALFGPQHGFWAEQQDDMVTTPHGRDPELGIPVYSLYGEHRRPTPRMLDIDVLVVDLQDVGVRAFTFLWTLSLCLEACAERGIPVLVLDRPNPLGGEVIEGPLLEQGFATFVGRCAMPMRHGLTIAEAAAYVNRQMGIDADLSCVPMTGWNRSMGWADTGRTWIGPSPNLPRVESVLNYPGQVLVEGTCLSEGRGTTTPFEVVGAPFVDPHALLDALRSSRTDAAALRPVRFLPTFDKHAGQSCGGLHIHPRDPHRHRSYGLAIGILAAVRTLWPEAFGWRGPPFEYEHELLPIDMLTGSDRTRLALDRGPDPAGLEALSSVDADAWRTRTSDCRMYA